MARSIIYVTLYGPLWTVHVKEKQSRYRPGVAQRALGSEGSQIS